MCCANCIENWSQNREHRKLLIACCYCMFRLNLNLKLRVWAEEREDEKNDCNFMQILEEREREYKVQS